MCQLGFAVLRSAVSCLRGSRSTFTLDLVNTNIDLALSEGRVSYLFFLKIIYYTSIIICIETGEKKANANFMYSRMFVFFLKEAMAKQDDSVSIDNNQQQR